MSVSVVIPAYNVSGVIARAIRSALDQTVKPLEIIVIDDCSTDDTVAIVKAIANPLIRILSTPENGGPSAARNVGLSEARGDWVALLDSDDVWKPEFIERLIPAGESNAADLILVNLILWDNIAEREVRVALVQDEPVRKVTVRDLVENDSVDFKFVSFSWGTLKAVFRRSFLTQHGLRYDENMRMGEDFVFFAEILFNGAQAILVAEPYYVYSMPTPPSGKSAHSRTQYNFLSLLEKSDALSRRYADRIDPGLAAAIARRRTVIQMIHEANVARQHRRSRQYVRYAWYVATKPRLMQSLFFRGIHNVAQRARQAARA
jgi:succinoglycan biosynthesis protein ExoO